MRVFLMASPLSLVIHGFLRSGPLLSLVAVSVAQEVLPS